MKLEELVREISHLSLKESNGLCLIRAYFLCKMMLEINGPTSTYRTWYRLFVMADDNKLIKPKDTDIK
jgi:hypothetical protein